MLLYAPDMRFPFLRLAFWVRRNSSKGRSGWDEAVQDGLDQGWNK